MDKCKCGFPIPPVARTIKESVLGGRSVIVKHEKPCIKCGEVYTIYG